MKECTMKIRKFKKNVILKVPLKPTSGFKLRIFLAIKLITLAALILGCGIKVQPIDLMFEDDLLQNDNET